MLKPQNNTSMSRRLPLPLSLLLSLAKSLMIYPLLLLGHFLSLLGLAFFLSHLFVLTSSSHVVIWYFGLPLVGNISSVIYLSFVSSLYHQRDFSVMLEACSTLVHVLKYKFGSKLG